MERLWIIASGLCLIVAAILLLRENYNAAFVAAALGAVAWFLNYRSKIRATLVEEDETTDDDREASEDEDER
jgi:Flp pilus assembly protein TadB